MCIRDRKSGYIKNIYTRVSKRRYLMSKYLAVFLCGGLAVVLPLVVNLGVTAVILPSHLPEIVTSVYTIDATAVLGDLFITQPYLCLLYTSISSRSLPAPRNPVIWLPNTLRYLLWPA